MIKIFLFCFYKIWFEPMFLTGSFAVLIRADPPPFRIFAGGISSPPQAAKAVRTNSSILHHVGKVNASRGLCLRSATSESLTFPTWCSW